MTHSVDKLPVRRCLIHTALALLLICSRPYPAQAQEYFSSPENAADALVAAAARRDRPRALTILGDPNGDILFSGDQVNDNLNRQIFLRAYQEKHTIRYEDPHTATLLIGESEWPFAIPIMKHDGQWHFDLDLGKQELLFRRVGRNELSTQQAMLAYVDAQNEYAEIQRQRVGKAIYAQHLLSNPNKQDGLYWRTEPGQAQSPLGELIAKASAEGYKRGEGKIPYHGYYYEILKQQGPSASGGKLHYVVDGDMIGGFALIAYPVKYGNSGIKSFMINHEGVLYEKDLGENTVKTASAISAFNPDDSWQVRRLPAHLTSR